MLFWGAWHAPPSPTCPGLPVTLAPPHACRACGAATGVSSATCGKRATGRQKGKVMGWQQTRLRISARQLPEAVKKDAWDLRLFKKQRQGRGGVPQPEFFHSRPNSIPLLLASRPSPASSAAPRLLPPSPAAPQPAPMPSCGPPAPRCG